MLHEAHVSYRLALYRQLEFAMGDMPWKAMSDDRDNRVLIGAPA